MKHKFVPNRMLLTKLLATFLLTSTSVISFALINPPAAFAKFCLFCGDDSGSGASSGSGSGVGGFGVPAPNTSHQGPPDTSYQGPGELHCQFLQEGCPGGGAGDGGVGVDNDGLYHDPDYYTKEQERIEAEHRSQFPEESHSPDEGTSDSEHYPRVCIRNPSLEMCN